MQTVNFNCPHCGNLMAVGLNLLGRNVRCPHCKQVVRAPAPPTDALAQTPAPPPTPAPPQGPPPTFNVPQPTEHHESIFGERHDEDVFGSEPPKPTMPPAPAPPPVPAPPQLQETVSVNMPTAPLPPPPLPDAAFGAISSLEFQAVDGAGAIEQRQADRAAAKQDQSDFGYRARTARDEAPGTPAFAWILLAYAAIVTIAAGFFGFKYFMGRDSGPHPYKAMPDVLRQYDPAKKPQVSFQGLPDPKLDIPADLRVKLGNELTVGDLKVEPLFVERKRLEGTTKYVSADDKVREIGETLVLTLRVKNLSADTTFCPNDPAFYRALDAKQPPPYTGLQIRREYFYGTFKWPPDTGTEKEFINGHENDDRPLRPGEDRDTWVALAGPKVRTSASNDILQALDNLEKNHETKLQLLWRVQLRRGLVKMKNDAGQDMDVSATTVIGVEFTASEIK